MDENETEKRDNFSAIEELAARWDKAAYRAQGSPFEELSVSALAKSSDTRVWSRPGGKIKQDSITRYIYLSFEELMEVEKLDLKSAIHLLEICEATFIFEEECDDMGSFEEIDNQAYHQRMRFVEEYGLYEDFPVALGNLDLDFRELCAAEEVITFVELMAFLDRLSDKALIGGSYRNLQNVFAHGDEKGLAKYFPYRVGHRGLHLPEALSFTLNRLSQHDREAVFEYYEQRHKHSFLRIKQMEIPDVVQNRLIPEIITCLHYFGNRQPSLLVSLQDSANLRRVLMFLGDPKVEGVLYWLVQLTLGLFLHSKDEKIEGELEKLSLEHDTALLKDLKELFKKEAG